MFLRTTKPILINEGLTVERYVIIELHIERVTITLGKETELQYRYKEYQGGDIGGLRNTFIPAAQTDALYQQIKTSIPVGLSDSQHQEYKYYIGARFKMWELLKSKNLKLGIEDIELIIPKDGEDV